MRGAAEVPLTVVVTRAAPRTAVDALEVAGAEVVVATGANEPDRVRNSLAQLGAAGVTSILLEGGPHLAGAFLDAGEVDEIRLFVAPVVLGGSSARDPLEGEGAERIASALRALSLECERVGRGRVDPRPNAGVVADVHRAGRGPRDGHRRRRHGRRRAARRAAPRWRLSCRWATRWRSTASA